jgi:hypothetical protein
VGSPNVTARRPRQKACTGFKGGMYLFDHIQFVSIFTNDLDDAPNIRRRRTKSPPE